jgi:uncharacterized protein YkwD
MILTAVTLVSVAGGGWFALGQGSHGPDWSANALNGLADSSLMIAAQPQPDAGQVGPAGAPTPSGAPTATPKASSSAKKTATPTPTKPTATKTKKPSPPAASGSVVAQLLAQINQLRAQNGVAPLTLSSGLIASAHKHNLKMMGSCGMQHQCPGEASLGDRISAEGVHWSACGENIGWSGPHPNTNAALISAAEGLTTSMYNEKPPNDGHRRNLLSSSFHHIGIDVVRDSSGKVWLTQDFSN